MHAFDYIFAVDGGGTKTDAALRRPDGTVLAEIRTGPCNLFQNMEAGLTAISDAWAACCADARLDQATIIGATCLSAGLAGINTPGAPEQVRVRFAGFAACKLSSDGYATLAGAFPTVPGALLAIGTGTVACRFDGEGRFTMRGGWGFPVGDQGGGAWMGLQLVSRWLRHRDGAAPDPASAPLWSALADHLGDERGAILDWLRGAPPGRFAELAPLALTLECPAASAVRREAVSLLFDLVGCLGMTPDDPLALTGGLAGALASDLAAVLAPRSVTQIASSALEGAFGIAVGRRAQEFERRPAALPLPPAKA
jgi:glucosamine kinase